MHQLQRNLHLDEEIDYTHSAAQQHPPAAFCSTFCPKPLIVDLPPGPDAIEVDPILDGQHYENEMTDRSPVLDLFGHGQESLLNVGCILGRGLQEWNAQLVRECLLSAAADTIGLP